MKELTIWNNGTYPEEILAMLREGVAGHRLLRTAEGAAALSDADVAFGQPDPAEAREATRLKWVHLDSAGYERYDTPELRAALQARDGMLTNSSSVYDEPCAQHTVALMLSLARRLPQSFAVQSGDHSWPMMALRAETYLLNGQTTLFLGFGAIGRRLTELLAPFGMNMIACRRQRTQDDRVHMITESELPMYLAVADHVVNILPASDSTRGFMSEARFNQIKPGAIFYNIGRGSTVDQTALLAALASGRLAAACLDVTDPEPLPPDHPLWTAPNCHITPHTAGGHIGEKQRQVRHFLANLRRYAAGEPLQDRVI